MHPTRPLLIFTFLFLSLRLFAGNFSIPGAESLGLSRATIAQTESSYTFDNQAALANMSYFALGAHYYNRYGLSEISTRYVNAMHALGNGGVGYRLSYFGSQPYNEIQTGIAYGLKLIEKLSLGVELDYYRTYLETENNKQSAVSGDIAILIQATSHFSLGVQATTISNSSYFNYQKEQLSSGVRAGIMYHTATYGLLAEAEYQKENSMQLKFGAYYELIDNFKVRLGVNDGKMVGDVEKTSYYTDTHYSLGLGYALKGIHADLGFIHHPILGFSSVISLGYIFNSEK